MTRDEVTVAVVTYRSPEEVAPCFAAVAALAHRPLAVVVVDCASGDGTPAAIEAARPVLAEAGVPLNFLPLADNLGFAGGMNRALAASSAPWVLSLNADARPAADFVTRLLQRAGAHPEMKVGAVTGKLVRPAGTGETVPRLDACGMRLTRTWRHLDRGSGELDRGQFDLPARIFGATGAATLLRRQALDDVAVEGEIFDARFHSFREDAELAFRLRERGWEILYEPTARCLHRRFSLPERRRSMPPEVNRHSLKNRYLLRLYHQTAGNLLRTLPQAMARDLAALAYALAVERSSLPAYAWLWRHRQEILRRRRLIQGRRTVPPATVDAWFGREEIPL